MRKDGGGFEELDPLVLGQHELARLVPVQQVLLAVLDKAVWVPVHLCTCFAHVRCAPPQAVLVLLASLVLLLLDASEGVLGARFAARDRDW
jgi:hypothetical protein